MNSIQALINEAAECLGNGNLKVLPKKMHDMLLSQHFDFLFHMQQSYDLSLKALDVAVHELHHINFYDCKKRNTKAQ